MNLAHFVGGCVLTDFHLLFSHYSPLLIWAIVFNLDGNIDIFRLNLLLLEINGRLFAECLVDWDFGSINFELLTRVRQLTSSVHKLDKLFLFVILSGNLDVIDCHSKPHVFWGLRKTLDTLEHFAIVSKIKL